MSKIRSQKMSDAERVERLEELGLAIAEKRNEAVAARKASGIEDIWLACEEAYLGIDDMNRHEFAVAKWAKPTSIKGPVTTDKIPRDEYRSTAYVRLSSRYADNASAKLCEILLPIDDKAFSIQATPIPDLIKQKEDLTQIIDTAGNPAMRPANAPNQAGMPTPNGIPAQVGVPMVPVTVADKAKFEIDRASKAAEMAEKRIYDWMEESKYPAEMRKVIRDSARLGVGVLKGPFPEIKTSKAMTKVNDAIALQIKKEVKPVVRWIDPWNFYPADGCGESPHDGDYSVELDFLSHKKLRELKRQEGYLNDQIDKVLEEGPGKCFSEGGNPNDAKLKGKRFEIWHIYCTLKRSDMELAEAIGIEDISHDHEEVFAIASLVNDTVIRAVINPMDSGALPYRTMSWSRRPGHWAGVGPIEQISMPQRMVNASTRALLNNAGLSAGPQIVIDQFGIVPADNNYKLTPNKIWYKTEDSVAKSVQDCFASVVIPSVQQELMGIIEYGMKLAEEASGIPLITQGQTGPTTPETFGAAELQNNNAHTWLRSIAYAFDDQITEPVVNDYYEWLLLDPSVPDEEKGDFEINAHGSIAMVERAIQEVTLMGLLSASSNPAFKLDPSKLAEEYLKSKRLDPRKIQFSKEEQDKMAQQPQQPPIEIAVEQIRGQNAIKLQQARNQAEFERISAEAQHEQNLLAQGGATPHATAANARIEQERIRAISAQNVEASRSHAEMARADKEFEIARQNGQMRIHELELKKELALLDYANKHSIQLSQVKAELAKSAIDSQTKKELAAAEIQLSMSENETNRAHQSSENEVDRRLDVTKHAVDVNHDATKHNNSLVRDMMSTPNTP